MIILLPVNTLIIFLAVPAVALFHTCRSTYDHHAGLHSSNPLLASYNRINPTYNLLSQNLGYHTAHHMRPGLHWSMLPAYHEEIRAGIPSKLIHRTFWSSDSQGEYETERASAAE